MSTVPIYRTCPYLGLWDDADTSLAFPSVWNNCFRSHPPAIPKLKHQAEFCLSDNYRACPLFLSQQSMPLPKHLRALSDPLKKKRISFGRNLVILLVLAVIMLVLAWGYLSGGSFAPLTIGTKTPTASITAAPTSTNTPSLTATASLTSTTTQTATMRVIASGSVTITSPPTRTAATTRTPSLAPLPIHTATRVQTKTPTLSLSSHRLDLPIGTDHKFVIHKVLNGENLNQYAATYNTSVEAILAVSYKLKAPVWVDSLVVIPVGFTDVAGLPSFEAYQLIKSGRSVEALAQELGVAAADLKYYNAIVDGESLLIGDWLLIPRARPA